MEKKKKVYVKPQITTVKVEVENLLQRVSGNAGQISSGGQIGTIEGPGDSEDVD